MADESWAIAGTVGTWVAVAIGLIALIGIVGPLLILLGSRTEKHRILSAIGNDTNGYISSGVHLGPNIYLGRRIRAPRLKNLAIERPVPISNPLEPHSVAKFRHSGFLGSFRRATFKLWGGVS